MKRTLYFLAVWVGVVTLCATSCRKGPKPLPLKSVAEARAVAMGSAVLPSLDRTFERVEGVAKALSLPFDKASQRTSFLEKMKIPSAVLSAVRTDAPVAVVGLPGKGKGTDPEVVVVATGTSAAALKTAIAGLGKPVSTNADVNAYTVEKETVWIAQRDVLLLAASSLEALVAGGSLAQEVAVKSEDDLVVRLSPEAVAKGQGTDLKTALAGVVAAGTTSLEGIPGKNPMATAIMKGMLQGTMDRVAEVEEAMLSLRLDAAKGATLQMAATPKKGTKLATWIGKHAPYALDGRVVPEGETMALMAFSPTDLLSTLWADVRPLVAKDKAGEDAAKQIDTLLTAWSFGGSGAMAIEGKEMKMAGVYGMKPGSDGEAFISAMAGLMEGPWYTSLLSAGEMKSKVTTKREKNLLVVSVKNDMQKGLPKGMAEAFQGMGLLSQTYAVTVAKDTMFYATGSDAATRARALASQAPRKPAGLASQAVAESAGADAFMFFDFGPFVRMGAAAMGGGENPLFASMSLPLWLSYRGGSSAAMDLRIPMELAKAVSAFVPMLMQMGLAGKGLGGPN